MASESINWGYVLVAPGRPSRKVQMDCMAALGLDVGEPGTVWMDRVSRGSTRPRGQLTEREHLVEKAVQPGDTVVIAAPFCLGVSASDAKWFLSALAEAGVTVIVNGELTRVQPGDDVTGLVQAVATAQNVANVYRSTGRIKK